MGIWCLEAMRAAAPNCEVPFPGADDANPLLGKRPPAEILAVCEAECANARRKLDAVLKRPSFDGEQIVCLLMILRAEVNVGYEEQVGQLAALNGEPVQSLKQLKEQVEAIQTGALCFRLDSGEMIVISADKCWASEADIFRLHRIPARASADLL